VDKTVQVWDSTTGALVARGSHASPICSAIFLPDNLHIASISDATLQVWNCETDAVAEWSLEAYIDPNANRPYVAFAPDGRRVVFGSGKTFRVLNSATGEVSAGPFEGNTDEITVIALSPDGQRIASGSALDTTVIIWDCKTGAVMVVISGHTMPTCDVAFSPDGKKLATGSRDRTARIWDVEIGVLLAGPFEGHTDFVSRVIFSPDGRWIASCSLDLTMQLWDSETGNVLAGPFGGHTEGPDSIAFSPDGRRIVSGSFDKAIRVWEVRVFSGALLLTYRSSLVGAGNSTGWLGKLSAFQGGLDHGCVI
jgi:WD40 repeat protein